MKFQLFVLLSCFFFSVSAQDFTLLRDHNAGSIEGVSSPFEYGILPSDNLMYYLASVDGGEGEAVYATDGTIEGTNTVLANTLFVGNGVNALMVVDTSIYLHDEKKLYTYTESDLLEQHEVDQRISNWYQFSNGVILQAEMPEGQHRFIYKGLKDGTVSTSEIKDIGSGGLASYFDNWLVFSSNLVAVYDDAIVIMNEDMSQLTSIEEWLPANGFSAFTNIEKAIGAGTHMVIDGTSEQGQEGIFILDFETKGFIEVIAPAEVVKVNTFVRHGDILFFDDSDSIYTYDLVAEQFSVLSGSNASTYSFRDSVLLYYANDDEQTPFSLMQYDINSRESSTVHDIMSFNTRLHIESMGEDLVYIVAQDDLIDRRLFIRRGATGVTEEVLTLASFFGDQSLHVIRGKLLFIDLADFDIGVELYRLDAIWDFDMDGFTNEEDCVDYDAAINPGAEEILDNGIDDNCDGIEGTTGVEDFGSVFQVYPNPSEGYVTLSTVVDRSALALYTITGEQVPYELTGQRMLIREKGIFVLKITSGHGVQTVKLFVH